MGSLNMLRIIFLTQVFLLFPGFFTNSLKSSEPAPYSKTENTADNSEAIILNQKLIKSDPNNAEYHYQLGRAYYKTQAYNEAIDAYSQGLELQPENADIQLGLGYALLASFKTHAELNRSKELFEKVLKQYPDYTDAQTGLKEVERQLAKIKENESADSHPSDNAKKIDEKNEKSVSKTNSKWVEVFTETAQNLSKQQDHWGAKEIYLQLLETDPKNVDLLYALGREYIKLEMYCEAKEILQKVLEIKPDYPEVLVALAKLYLNSQDLCTARSLYATAYNFDSSNIDALFGLARVEALLDHPEAAEQYYQEAIDIESDNIDILRSFAGFLLEQRRYCESLGIYRRLVCMEDDQEKYRYTIFDTSSHTDFSVFIKTGAAEEKEKDLFTHEWDASIRYLYAEAGVIYPINDQFRVSARVTGIDTRQRLLVSHTTQFDALSVGGALQGDWFYDPNWTFTTGARMEWISNNDDEALLPTKQGTKFEPMLICRYVKGPDTVFFGEITDSWIFRDFAKVHLRVIARETAILSYQHDFESYRLFGANVLWLWYQDPVYNQEQDVNVWFQAGVPYLEDLLAARYHCEYRQFKHEVTGYYSFKYQLTQWLKLISSYRWLSGFRYEIAYWHGWRTTRGANPQQQIIIGPAPLFPIVTVEYQVDQLYMTLGYMPTDNCDISISADYYHDSFDYTTYGAKLLLDTRF